MLKGTFDVGYEINKKKYYRIKYGPGNVVGAFNLTFHYRFQFAIKAASSMHCFCVKKKNWFGFMNQFPEF